MKTIRLSMPVRSERSHFSRTYSELPGLSTMVKNAVADSWDDLTNGELQNPIMLTETLEVPSAGGGLIRRGGRGSSLLHSGPFDVPLDAQRTACHWRPARLELVVVRLEAHPNAG